MERSASDDRNSVSPQQFMTNALVTVTDAKSRLSLLQDFVRDYMVAGVDYGLIPGWSSKPSLLKPGAEKLCDIFGFSKHATILSSVEDWQRGIFAYNVKTTLISKHSGITEADGLGSCNTRERRYRGQDPYTMANTVLKIAKKRSLVDAVLTATRSSGLFTQDVEDLTHAVQVAPLPTRNDLNALFALVKLLGLTVEQAREILLDRYGVERSSRLNMAQLEDLTTYLRDKTFVEITQQYHRQG